MKEMLERISNEADVFKTLMLCPIWMFMIAMVMMFLIQAWARYFVVLWKCHHGYNGTTTKGIELVTRRRWERQQSQHTQPILTGNLLLLTCCMDSTSAVRAVIKFQ